jgi:hypothetical protein
MATFGASPTGDTTRIFMYDTRAGAWVTPVATAPVSDFLPSEKGGNHVSSAVITDPATGTTTIYGDIYVEIKDRIPMVIYACQGNISSDKHMSSVTRDFVVLEGGTPSITITSKNIHVYGVDKTITRPHEFDTIVVPPGMLARGKTIPTLSCGDQPLPLDIHYDTTGFTEPVTITWISRSGERRKMQYNHPLCSSTSYVPAYVPAGTIVPMAATGSITLPVMPPIIDRVSPMCLGAPMPWMAPSLGCAPLACAPTFIAPAFSSMKGKCY